MSSYSCAVTGANGFMGAHVARALLARGHRVIALVGRDLDMRGLEGLDVETRPLDLCDAASVRAGLTGADTVIHTAASYAFWAPDVRDLYRVNVDGTRHVLAAARELGARKIVCTSTTGTLSPGFRFPADAETPTDENAAFDLSRFRGHYKMSKMMAEALALREAARGLPVVLTHPTTVIGPGDRRPTPTGVMIREYLAGNMKVRVDMRQNIVDVRDVALGHVLALEKAEPGERYVLGGENLSMRALMDLLAELTGIPAPRIPLPLPLLYGIGAVSEWIADHLTRRMPLATRESALHARDSRFADSGKAIRELGYAPRPAREALVDAVAFFREQTA